MHIRIVSSDGRLLTGEFGLERETLRVTADGHMAHTLHPFSDDPYIVKDFCENQAEINTGVHNSAEGVIGELAAHSRRLENAIAGRGERLWLYSNPPILNSADDIPVAVYQGEQKSKHSYRLYLAEKYGKYKMTLSGIHVNYSLSEELLRQGFEASAYDEYTAYKNAVYLRLAEKLVEHGWIINLLLAASPVCDGSYFSSDGAGKPIVTQYASLRCGEEGYWNSFIPQLDYRSVRSYAQSIQRYIESGTLAGESELYYPIRLKPRGANRLEVLVQNGVNHIEIRNVDINPFAAQGIDARDLRFIELLILYLICDADRVLSPKEQEDAIGNFRNAALLDIDTAQLRLRGAVLSVGRAGQGLLRKMQDFYADGCSDATLSVRETLDYQVSKLNIPGSRYADRVIAACTERHPDVLAR